VPHVLVAGRIHDAGLAVLKGAPGITVEMIDEVSTESYAPHIYGADALLIRTQPLPAPVIATAQRLRVVSRHGVGYDAVDVRALTARGIPLTVVGDVNSRTVAEHTFALMLALAKRIPAYDAAVRDGNWNIRNGFSARELWGRTLLLVGFGRIGRIVAEMARVFGMTVLVFDPFQSAEAIRAAGAEPVEALLSGLRQADIVSLHVPKTGDEPLIGAAELRQLKPAAFIINTARGGLVDETALAESLNAGRLAGAAVDVFEAEPPSRAAPLLACDNALLTPHSAGLTEECAARMGQKAAQNILDYFAGRLDPALVVNAGDLPTADGQPD
jgi:D-3-phosphoglycerate dehydrogenase / 2-oxoglutarate reductase